jgi:hypothetical protein
MVMRNEERETMLVPLAMGLQGIRRIFPSNGKPLPLELCGS